MQNTAVGMAAQQIIASKKASSKGRVPHGFSKKVLDRFKGYNLTVSQLQYAVREAEKNMSLQPTEDVPSPIRIDISELDSVRTSLSESLRNKGGRPKGTTTAARKADEKKVEAALTDASIRFSMAKRDKKSNYVARYALRDMVDQVEKEHSLPQGSIKEDTIRRRVHRESVTGHNNISPIASLEPVIKEYCIRLAHIGQPITKDQVISIAIALAVDTPSEVALKCWKEKHSYFSQDSPLLGVGWFQGFMKRHQDELKRVRATIKDVNRKTWVKYEHFENMYNNVYARMIEAGVAVKLESKVWFNKDCDIVESKEDGGIGLMSDVQLVHPEYVVFVDETGVNTNQKADGAVGDQKFVVGKHQEDVGLCGATTDIHFTVLVFTAATGQPIMCSVIMKSEQDVSQIPTSWKLGIDITKRINLGDGDDDTTVWMNNEHLMIGGPVCRFRGKEIPCYIGTSPKASITSYLLADMLKCIDELDVFDRTADGRRPFLLLDGHHSRMELPFLDYIHGTGHKWVVCIGVPYATHLWQVADASQLNGCFKVWITKVKRMMYDAMPLDKKRFTPSDIIPMLNMAFEKSFANVKYARTAIAQRGWYPLTYNLLEHPEIKPVRPSNNSTAAAPDMTPAMAAAGTRHTVVTPSESGETSLLSINISQGAAENFFDVLLLQEMQNRGRKEAMDKKKAEQDVTEDTYGKLKKMGRVTSGQLAAEGHFHLDKHVHRAISEKVRADKATAVTAAAARAVRVESHAQKLEAAKAARMEKPVEALNTTELGKLIGSLKLQADSPVKGLKDERIAQLRRREMRLAKSNRGLGGLNRVTNLDLRVLIHSLWMAGDEREENLIVKDRSALETELERRERRQALASGPDSQQQLQG